MRRRLALVLGAVVLAAGSVSAHHSYAAYDRDHPVSIEGDIIQVAYENPHTMLSIRTADAVYTLEWGALSQLRRANVVPGELKVGDHLVVTGAPFRDPSTHKLSILTDIRRPADGWRWQRWGQPATFAPSSSPSQ
jgi:hypothetical protein